MLEKWAGTTRYVYNKMLARVKVDNSHLSKEANIIKECITEKDNNIVKEGQGHNFDNFLYEWELETPKDIRKGAWRDIKKGYKTAWANLKAGNINNFGLNPRLKKNGNAQSMEVPRSAIDLCKSKKRIVGLSIYKTYFTKNKINPVIKVDQKSLKGLNLNDLEHDTRLKKENNQWFLCISYDVKGQETKIKEKTCAIDPGSRETFVIYSEDKLVKIFADKQRIYKLYSILDKFQELRSKKLIKQKTYNRKRCRVQAKLQNLIDELHYKTIAFLTKNYTSILLPSFETQDMVRSKKLHSKVKRDLMNLAFYKFKQRLEHKCKLLKHCNVTIVNEAYTSQTCGLCGNLKKTSSKIIQCDKCEHIFDRDVNGSRNIYLKYISC